MANRLSEVSFLFFKLGCIAFGGPAAHIALIEDEVVEKRKWMSREHFLDLIGATNLIPGPNSTEMAMHCGHERAGWPGLFVAGICFIVPAVAITTLFAWMYTQYGALPELEPFMFGIRASVLALIASAVMKLAKKAVKNVELVILGVLVLALSLVGLSEVLALLGAGVLGGFYFWMKRTSRSNQLHSFVPLTLLFPATLTTNVILPSTVFLKFLKVGAILYGSGYVLFAYLDAELVTGGWLTRMQLMDAVAIGQITPGPVLSTAAFIGYQLDGLSGAVAASLGIFLPSFLFVLCLNPLIPKMRKSVLISGALDSLNIAAVAVMISILLKMGASSLQDWRSILTALVAFVFVFCFKRLSAAWVVPLGALTGFLLTLM